MMDWNLIPFEPNLKFASGLPEDLQTKYLEQHERAKQALENFSRSLKNVLNEHQKLLTDNLELSLLNEKLKQLIEKEPTQTKISTICNDPSSEILGASPNCKLDRLPKMKTINKVNKSYSQEILEQKENINELMPIYSCDFASDMEDETFGKCQSPPPPLVNTPEKVQNSSLNAPEKIQSSPILSKRKRFNSKKNNSSASNTSSHSITSSNDSKISNTNTPNLLERNINEVEIDVNKESQKVTKKEFGNEIKKKLESELKKEPLKTIQNTLISNSLQCNNNNNNHKNVNLLGVSTINYGRTEYAGKGKKLRQTKLTLKKAIPVIDISKVDSQESLDNDKSNFKHKSDNSWGETIFDNDKTYTKKRKNKGDIFDNKRECIDERNIDQIKKARTEDDELIETSPAPSEKSKLRNKLSLKKIESEKIQVKTPNTINNALLKKELTKCNSRQYELKNKNHETNKKDCNRTEDIFKPSSSKDNIKSSFNATAIKGKSFEPQRSLSDDTYFSPAELAFNENELEDDDIDITEFEDDVRQKTPPARKILMDSYDMVPGRYEKSPDFAYKEGPVRNKNERAQLQGWCCTSCEKWFYHPDPAIRKKNMDECSKHRGKHNVNQSSPDSLWNPVFDHTLDSTCE